MNDSKSIRSFSGISGPFIREHWIWVVGLVPVAVACLRLLVVSKGNRQVLGALVQGLDIPNLVIATMLPFVSTLYLWVMIGWAARRTIERREAKKAGKKLEANVHWVWFTAAWIIAIALLVGSTPSWIVLLNFGLLGAIVISTFTVWSHVKRKREDRTLRSGLVALFAAAVLALGGVGGLLALVLVPTVFLSSMWLPKENLVVERAGRTSVTTGYVLGSDPRWTRILTEDDRVLIFRTESVTERQQIPLETSWWSKTPRQLLN